METFSAGTLAGAGCFRCDTCGYSIALHELDEIPVCPSCGEQEFKRSSIFEQHTTVEPAVTLSEEKPPWLDDARDALVAEGSYLAYEDDERVHVVPLQEGWTRLGRSLAAHVRFDDPTVSRRHALIHREGGHTKLLDDRSLNGVFVDGERVEWCPLEDGAQIVIGRFTLHYMRVPAMGADAAADVEATPA